MLEGCYQREGVVLLVLLHRVGLGKLRKLPQLIINQGDLLACGQDA